jgi:hypothetical protein
MFDGCCERKHGGKRIDGKGCHEQGSVEVRRKTIVQWNVPL